MNEEIKNFHKKMRSRIDDMSKNVICLQEALIDLNKQFTDLYLDKDFIKFTEEN